MDHNYNDSVLLTNSDIEYINEDLKHLIPEQLVGSSFNMEQNSNYNDSMMVNPMMRPVMSQDISSSPLSLQEVGGDRFIHGSTCIASPEQFGPGAVQTCRGAVAELVTAPPESSPPLSPDGTIPSRDEYPGQFGFELLLDTATSSRRSWLYSLILKKVFIDINKSLLVQFHVNNFMNGLFVRALPVFEQDDYVSLPVERCRIHAISVDPHFRAHPIDQPGVCYCHKHLLAKHVVLSSNPQAKYEYNSESNRHSVVVPLQAPQPGSDSTTVEYQFVCKTSCPQGMNRKPIIVIFTLENEQREVLGRYVLPVKICSCPKRDKEKEEAEKEEKDKNTQDTPKLKKRRMSTKQEDTKKIKMEITETKEPTHTDDETNTDTKKVIEKISVVEKKVKILEQKVGELEINMTQKLTEMEINMTQKLEINMTQKLNELEINMTQKLNEIMTQKLNEKEISINHKFNEIKEEIKSALFQIGRQNYF